MKIFTIALLAAMGAGAFAQCCGGGACADSSKKPFNAKDAEYLALASAMKTKADRGSKPVMCDENPNLEKGAKGCCNAKSEPAKFKVFVSGQGYKFFGCKETATEGRFELIAANKKVGKVQAVSSKVLL